MPIVKKLEQHKLLLDTHVFLWFVLGNLNLKPYFLKIIENAADDIILLSPISIWEIGMLEERKRIELHMDCLNWIQKILAEGRFNILPISPKIAIQSSRLPGKCHGDPADRIIIASAHEEKAVLITSDKKILEYGKGQYLSVYNPQK